MFLVKLNQIFTAQEKLRAVLILFLFICVGFFDMIGVASIMPFLGVMADRSLVENNQYLSMLYERLGFHTVDSFLFFLGLTVLILVLGGIFMKAVTQWLSVRFSQRRVHELSARILRRYLDEDYNFHLQRHSADLRATVLSEVQQVVSGSLMSIVQIVGNSFIALFLIGLVVAVSPSTALVTLAVLSGAYILLYTFVHGYLAKIGSERLVSNKKRHKVLQEVFEGIKEIKILGLESTYAKEYYRQTLLYCRAQIRMAMTKILPQFALQAFAYSGIMIVLLVMLSTSSDLATILPVMAVYAVSGMRLLPALQSIYQGVVAIRFAGPALDNIHADLVGGGADRRAPKCLKRSGYPIKLNHRIELRDLDYAYPTGDRTALKGLNLTIEARSTVGLVGETGSGKTTVVDVILGLLKPQSGSVLIDGKPLVGDDIVR